MKLLNKTELVLRDSKGRLWVALFLSCIAHAGLLTKPWDFHFYTAGSVIPHLHRAALMVSLEPAPLAEAQMTKPKTSPKPTENNRNSAPLVKPLKNSLVTQRIHRSTEQDLLSSPNQNAQSDAATNTLTTYFEDARYTRVSELDQPPKRISAIEPIEYRADVALPPLILDVFVNKDGTVAAINTINYLFPDPILLNKVLVALKKVQFRPGERSGVAVDSVVRFEGALEELEQVQELPELMGPPYDPLQDPYLDAAAKAAAIARDQAAHMRPSRAIDQQNPAASAVKIHAPQPMIQ